MPGPDLSRRHLLALGGAGALALGLPRRAGADPAMDARLSGWAAAGTSGSFTLSNAVLVTHEGRRLDASGLRVEAGRVVELGPQVKGGTDLGGRWLTPGFTDAGCLVGLLEVGAEGGSRDDNEDSDAIQPDARAWDGYNPQSEVVAVTRAAGITHALVHPATNRLVPGQAGLFRMVGRTPDEALVSAPAALVLCLGHAATGGKGPTSRMGVSMRLRELMHGIELPEDTDEKPRRRCRKGEGEAPEADEDLSPADRTWRQVRLVGLRRGELPVLIKAERADDILSAIDLCAEWKLRGILLGGAEAWMVVEELAAAGMPAFLGPLTVQPDSFEHPHARYDNAAILHRAGVPIGFRTNSAHFSRGLSTSAGVAVAHGLPWEAAIAALTRGPSAALGGTPLGTLEAGGPASFFVTDGDPLQPRHAVRRMWIDGREVSLDNRQRRLLERYRELW
jgi:imidazolonepropionase-like amidohydrolase